MERVEKTVFLSYRRTNFWGALGQLAGDRGHPKIKAVDHQRNDVAANRGIARRDRGDVDGELAD